MLQVEFARARQKRLLELLGPQMLDAVVLGQPAHVYYLTAYLPSWLHQASCILFRDGTCWLQCAQPAPDSSATDKVIPFEAAWNGTVRQEQAAVVADNAVAALAARKVSRIGVDASAVTAQVLLTYNEAVSIEPDLRQLRRRKDPDELALIKTAIRCTEAMYRRARQIIEPGVQELYVFNELHAVAVDVAGEPLTAPLGNDFACGAGGGPPRKGRAAKAGELYILDLGPAHRGYFADASRAFAVDRRPTDAQLRAWELVTGVFPIVERLARPGVRCRAICKAVDSYYREKGGQPFPHHLGHGFGLQPHEFPHLNPKWDDVLIEGEVFTCEPGIYAPDLSGGLRIENDYLVTRDGVVNLTPFPMEY